MSVMGQLPVPPAVLITISILLSTIGIITCETNDDDENNTINNNVINGEVACENQGFDQAECLNVGCCEWDDGECWSSVGHNICSSNDNQEVDKFDNSNEDGYYGALSDDGSVKDENDENENIINNNVINGEVACENRGFGRAECFNVGCCQWDAGECWSAVGQDICSFNNDYEDNYSNGALDDDGSDKDESENENDENENENSNIIWSDPPSTSNWNICEKVTTVFGITVCVTQKAWQERIKINHIVNVFYQLLDKDGDGFPDDEVIHSEMVENGYLLFVPATEQDFEDAMGDNGDGVPDGVGAAQMIGTWEAIPNSCDTPTNRGASATNRSSWPKFVNTLNRDCINRRDATTEEILHLITAAAANVYPELWGANFQSRAGEAVLAANGNCGWGYTSDWTDPSTNECSGMYAYDDPTCDEGCLVIEGIYWAIVSFLGGLYTRNRARSVRSEWLMATPDGDMEVYPLRVENAVSLQLGSPELYDMVSDNTSVGHMWLPAIMPNGKYEGFQLDGASTSVSTSEAESPVDEEPTIGLSDSESPVDGIASTSGLSGSESPVHGTSTKDDVASTSGLSESESSVDGTPASGLSGSESSSDVASISGSSESESPVDGTSASGLSGSESSSDVASISGSNGSESPVDGTPASGLSGSESSSDVASTSGSSGPKSPEDEAAINSSRGSRSSSVLPLPALYFIVWGFDNILALVTLMW